LAASKSSTLAIQRTPSGTIRKMSSGLSIEHPHRSAGSV
jgi:hypothetical protein